MNVIGKMDKNKLMEAVIYLDNIGKQDAIDHDEVYHKLEEVI